MRLKYLWIEKFKNLENFEIDFEKGDGLTMLIGTNGSGKSNILEAVSAIFYDTYRSNKSTDSNNSIDSKYILCYFQGEQTIYIVNSNSNNACPLKYVQYLALPCIRKLNGKVDRIINIVDEDKPLSKEIRLNLIETISNETKLRDKSGIPDLYESFVIQNGTRTEAYLPSKIIAIYSGEENRLYNQYFKTPYVEFSKKLVRNQITKLRLQYLDRNYWWIAVLVLALGELDNAAFLNQELNAYGVKTVKFYFSLKEVERNRYTPLKDFIDRINPTKNSEIEVPFLILKEIFLNYSGKEIFNIFNQGAMSEVVRTIDGVDVIFSNGLELAGLSEGEKKQLLFKLMSEYLADEESIILLDEPDAHIHEKKKTDLYCSLVSIKENNGPQIVLTSHSPTFVDISGENEIVAINKANDGKAIIMENDKLNLIKYLTGSRMDIFTNLPAIYCEGGEDSLDKQILQTLFVNKNIIAVGDCETVINKTKLHNDAFPNTAIGIIDSDYHTQERKEELATKKVYVLDVLEIENVLMDEAIIQATKNKYDVSEENILDFKSHFFSIMKKDLVCQAAKHTSNVLVNEIKMNLKTENRDIEKFKKNIESIFNSLKIDELYSNRTREIEDCIQKQQYNDLVTRVDFTHELDRFFNKNITPHFSRRVCSLIESNIELQDVLRRKYYYFIE